MPKDLGHFVCFKVITRCTIRLGSSRQKILSIGKIFEISFEIVFRDLIIGFWRLVRIDYASKRGPQAYLRLYFCCPLMQKAKSYNYYAFSKPSNNDVSNA